MKKLVISFLMLIVLIPNVLADILVEKPTFQDRLSFVGSLILLILANYLINLILIFIQSKIWLKTNLKKIAIGLLIITPIIFLFEFGMIELGYDNERMFLPAGLSSFIIIGLDYFIISKFFWNLNNKKSVITAILMGLLTNPFVLFWLLSLS